MIIDNDRLKQYTWGTAKGRRVFNQISDFGVQAWYDDELDEQGSHRVYLRFAKDQDGEISYTLSQYVTDLLSRGDFDWAYERFCKADMTIYE